MNGADAGKIPRERALDSSLALLSEGYRFIPNRCRRFDSDIFETRLMLRRAVCISGAEAAEVFYAPGRFTRHGAMPPTTLRLLQDKGSVQLLEGEAHHRRKAMFLSVLHPGAADRLAGAMAREWEDSLPRWAERKELVLHSAVREVLLRGVCAWAGVPLQPSEVERRTRELGAMIDGAGSVGPRNWRGQLLRARNERWARSLIARIRAGEIEVVEGSAVHAVAFHPGDGGEPLPKEVAAVELINILRPTVAVARYVTFAALALHEHPHARDRLVDDDYLERFVQEVRRFYPFFPLVGGRVREPFTWRGHRFQEGAWVLLDLYGTNRDARVWNDPGTFDPERFATWGGSSYELIPQGGGDHATGHRCPGEWSTIELVKRAVRLLATSMSYQVPEQDLRIDLSHMPAIPASGFVITDVRPAA